MSAQTDKLPRTSSTQPEQ